MSAAPVVNLWVGDEHARRYLATRDTIPHRSEGLTVLGEILPTQVDRVLDLGTGDGVTLGWVRELRPGCGGIGLDFSDEMLGRARARFAGESGVEIRRHDLDERLPGDLGAFDLVVSSFAIHHLVDARKRALYQEVFAHLCPGGRFVHLEHVASATSELHGEFLDAMGTERGAEDPSNKLAPLGIQLEWLREIGFENVDVFWKWRELALFAGRRPAD